METDEQETAFVKAFVVKDKQGRYLHFLASSRHRRDILDRLNHNLDFDPRYAVLVPQEFRTATKIIRQLQARGAGTTCHVIADTLDADGLDLPLAEALAQVIAHNFGSVVCCLPGRLAFYKPEAIERTWYIFERQQAEPCAEAPGYTAKTPQNTTSALADPEGARLRKTSPFSVPRSPGLPSR